MGKAMKKLFALAAGTTAAWALAIRPRTSGKPDMSEIRKYDFADRGYYNIRKKVPENSLPAFQAAVDHGYGIVMDVRLSRDGVPVIFRDSRLWRVCGGEGTVETVSYTHLDVYKRQVPMAHLSTIRKLLREVRCLSGRAACFALQTAHSTWNRR